MSVFRPSNHFHFQPFPWKPLEMEISIPMITISYAFPRNPFPTISKELGNGVTDCFYGGFFGHFQFPLFPYSTSSNGDCIKTSPHTLNQSDFFAHQKDTLMKHKIWNFTEQHYTRLGTIQITKTKKRTAAMFLAEPATVLTTPNFLENRHG